MTTFKIDKGVSPPPKGSKYPFSGMAVGDSFVVSRENAKNTRAAASSYGASSGMTFTMRKIGDDEFRVWRIE